VKLPRPTYHRDGYALWYKRLESGVFRFPADAAAAKEISVSDLGLILEGIDLRSVKRQKRFSLAR
jgi:transposase